MGGDGQLLKLSCSSRRTSAAAKSGWRQQVSSASRSTPAFLGTLPTLAATQISRRALRSTRETGGAVPGAQATGNRCTATPVHCRS